MSDSYANKNKEVAARIPAVSTALLKLKHMRGFPAEREGFEAVVRAIARFCETTEIYHGSVNPEFTGPGDLGQVVPLDWLMDEILDSRAWFPAPVEMRALYETKFAPLDGRSAASLAE